MARMTRSAVLNVLSSPAIEMAILKGVPRRRLMVRHALPNALGPIINVVALNLAYLISGVVIIETLFNFPGLGRYMVEGVTNRDVPIVQTCAMIFCTFYVLLNILADILSIMANPRVRYKMTPETHPSQTWYGRWRTTMSEMTFSAAICLGFLIIVFIIGIFAPWIALMMKRKSLLMIALCHHLQKCG